MAPAADAPAPVDKLWATDREGARRSVPLVLVVAVGRCAAQEQDRFQGDLAQAIRLISQLQVHGSWDSFSRIVTQSFMLKT